MTEKLLLLQLNLQWEISFKISCMKFQDPNHGEAGVIAHMKALNEEIQEAFRKLED